MESDQNTPLPVVERELNDSVILHIVNITTLTPELRRFIDEKIVEIYSKGHDSHIDLVKKKMREYFENKVDATLEIGAIAEFFIHLHLNKCGYQQECLFKNIEASKAIKKGFDGYYSKNGEGWMMESKSGKITTHNISHKDKVEEAFNDLSDKIGGGGNNNPWENAYHHACLAKTNADILKNIKDLSDKYTREIFSEIKDYNIIPGSTIFLDNKLAVIPEVEDINFIERDISKWLKTKEYKKMHIVCVTKKTKDIFLGYLNS